VRTTSQDAREPPAKESFWSLEVNTSITVRALFGNGRIGRRQRGELSLSPESEQEDEDEEHEPGGTDDETLVVRPWCPEPDIPEDELETESALARRCSNTPRPKS
jgi:hypothetical protein